jgi:hypothetical protein
VLAFSPVTILRADDKDAVPQRLPKEQREKLQQFLRDHEKPNRYIPADAKVVDAQPSEAEKSLTATADKPIKQYIAQIAFHRPVPGAEEVTRVDVYYYRPNPEKGKPGITVKHTVDLTTGKQVGETEVLYKAHTPISREEVAEAVALAKEKSPAVKDLYKDREENMVRWEYLQLLVNRKDDRVEPGDRVVRLVFTGSPLKENEPPAPHVPVLVNLTKGTVATDSR